MGPGQRSQETDLEGSAEAGGQREKPVHNVIAADCLGSSASGMDFHCCLQLSIPYVLTTHGHRLSRGRGSFLQLGAHPREEHSCRSSEADIPSSGGEGDRCGALAWMKRFRGPAVYTTVHPLIPSDPFDS